MRKATGPIWMAEAVPHARRTRPAASSSSRRASMAAAASSPSKSYQARSRREQLAGVGGADAQRGEDLRRRRRDDVGHARGRVEKHREAVQLDAADRGFGIGDVAGAGHRPAPRSARHLQRGVAGETAHPRLQTPYVIGIGLSGLRIDAGGAWSRSSAATSLPRRAAGAPAAAPRRACRARPDCRRAR